MSTRVVEIEWAEPLPTLTLGDNVEKLLALVRWQGRPIGLAWLSPVGGSLTAGELEEALEKQMQRPADQVEACQIDLQMPVSVIVCTHDRPDLLVTCLEALRPFEAEGHEIIIVDNAPSNSSTARLVKNYPYCYVCEPQPGLNIARNQGAAIAKHEILVFTDDDCIPDRQWLQQISLPYKDPEIGAVTGLVMPFELETPAQEAFEAYCANRRLFRPRLFHAPATSPSTAGVVGMGANMSIRRAFLRQVGGFDPRFDGGTPTLSGGDTEVFARLLEYGASIAYCPEALVWHRHCKENLRLRRVIYGYGAGLYAFLTKRLVEDHDWSVLVTAPNWLVGPPLKAIKNRVQGRPATSASLLFYEFTGALSGPWRYSRVRKLPHPWKMEVNQDAKPRNPA